MTNHANVADMTTLTPPILRYVGDRLRRGEIQPVTARNIRNHLLTFARTWGRRPVTQLGPHAVERYIEAMTTAGLAPSTQHGHLSSLRGFARWCVLHRISRTDWTIGAPSVRRPRAIARDVTNDHFAAVLSAARDCRERLIVWLMFDAGCRCVEVSRLSVDDVERDPAQLYLVGKAGHTRYVPISTTTVAAIDRYLDGAGHHSGPLVRTADGARRLGPERVSGLVGRMFRDSGVKVRPYDGRSAHGLRAAAATDLYEACEDPRLVQEFLGHADLQNLARYLRRATTARVRDAQLLRPHAHGQEAA